MTVDLDIRGVVIPAAELTWRFSRSSGPGGQSVNTTDSRVEVCFDLAATTSLPDVLKERALRNLEGRLHHGVLTVTAAEQRSQLMNRHLAVRRLVDLLIEATAPPPPPRRPTRPSRGMRERRLENKRRRGEVKRMRRAPGTDPRSGR